MTDFGPDQKSPNLHDPSSSSVLEANSNDTLTSTAISLHPILMSNGARLESTTMRYGVWVLEPIYEPLRIWCPTDQGYQITQVEKRPGFWACCMSSLLCSTCCWPCFFIPLTHPFCMDSVHRCTRCGRVLAVIPP